MSYRVVLTRAAQDDVLQQLDYIREHWSETIALRWKASIAKACETFSEHPARCPVADEAIDLSLPIRELLHGRRKSTHRILFLIRGQDVFVLRIWHASRDRLTPADLDDVS